MCLAIPGQVVAILPEDTDLVTVEVSGVRRNINIMLLDDGTVGLGDWVLIHVGFAMSKIDAAEAKATLALLEELGQVYTDELEAFDESWLE
jgi:hydrogenase expression/formation protein HypC